MSAVILGSWKRVPGPLETEVQVAVSPFHGCWESTSGPWKKEYMLLSIEPSLQPNILTLKM